MVRKQYESSASQTKSQSLFSFAPKTEQTDKDKNFPSITELFPFASGLSSSIHKFVGFTWLILLLFRGIAYLCQSIAVACFACQYSIERCIASICCIDFAASLVPSVRDSLLLSLLSFSILLLSGLSVSRI